MAYYNKIGLLVLNEGGDKFLVCQEYSKESHPQYLVPGGTINKDESEIECLKREIKEELNCEIKEGDLEFIGDYIDITKWYPDRDVSMKLYKGSLIGTPKPSGEIEYLYWIGKENLNDEKITPLTKDKIIPDLLKRRILKSV